MSALSNPVFSIIVPCYNQGIFLHDCLSSLINQTYASWEAIVVNDGSRDNTGEIAEEYSSRDKRIRLITKENGGLSSARNRGIQEAKGDRFIFLDSDDFLHPECLQEIYKAVTKIESNTLIRYGYSYVSEAAKEVIHTVLPPQETSMIPSVFSSVPGPCHTICINRKLLEKIGLFDESLRALEDWDFWIRAAKAGGKFVNISKPLAYYRQVTGSMSRDVEAMYQSGRIVINRIPMEDRRVKNGIENRNIEFDIKPVLKRLFIRILGVSIYQGNVSSSINFYRRESASEGFQFEPAEFSEMSSSLTFRYVRDEASVNHLLDNVKLIFKEFFRGAGFDDKFIKAALYHIFKKQMMIRNQKRWGLVLSKQVNFILRTFHGQ